MLDPITIETIVDAAQDAAFDTFVRRIDAWWPMDPFSLSNGIVVMEPKLGGRIIETSADGERFVWGHVTAFDPPHGIELAWYVGRTVEKATQIAIAFEPNGEGKTTVRLVHSGWEALGDEAAEISKRYDVGWRQILGTVFTDFVAQLGKEGSYV